MAGRNKKAFHKKNLICEKFYLDKVLIIVKVDVPNRKIEALESAVIIEKPTVASRGQQAAL